MRILVLFVKLTDCPLYFPFQASGEESDEEDKKKIEIGGKKKGSGSSASWDWMKDLFDLIKRISGLRKLSAERPSTAAIGNLSIIQAFEALSERFCNSVQLSPGLPQAVSARLFMGKKTTLKTKMDCPISGKDSHEDITGQWNKLR